MKKHEKKGLEAPKFHQKSPKCCPGPLRKGFWKKVGKHVNANDSMLRHFGLTWAILVDFWEPAKSRGVPKTVRNIEYGVFLAPKGGWKALKGCFRSKKILIRKITDRENAGTDTY